MNISDLLIQVYENRLQINNTIGKNGKITRLAHHATTITMTYSRSTFRLYSSKLTNLLVSFTSFEYLCQLTNNSIGSVTYSDKIKQFAQQLALTLVLKESKITPKPLIRNTKTCISSSILLLSSNAHTHHTHIISYPELANDHTHLLNCTIIIFHHSHTYRILLILALSNLHKTKPTINMQFLPQLVSLKPISNKRNFDVQKVCSGILQKNNRIRLPTLM